MELILTNDNYFSPEANKEYMSVSQFKDFCADNGRTPCEFKALEKLEGRWEDEKSDALIIGSYVDSYFEGTLDKYKEENPDLFSSKGPTKGQLKAKYQIAEKVIDRINRDDQFLGAMSGEKQKIMTGEIGGIPWKIKIDSLLNNCIVDLKVMACIDDKKAFVWAKEKGYVFWVDFWGYDIQGAVYQEIVRQNTGEKLPFYLAAASKDNCPSLRLIALEQFKLDTAIEKVKRNLDRVVALKNHDIEPERCELCDCCREARVLPGAIASQTLENWLLEKVM